MLNTARLFEEKPNQGNSQVFSAEIPDLFGSKFDRLNPTKNIAGGETNLLFDTNSDLTDKPDLVAATTDGAINLFDQFTDFGLLDTGANNLKFDRSLTSGPDTNSQESGICESFGNGDRTE